MPFVIVMRPDPKSLSITLHRTKEEIDYDASISGTFMNLLHLVDGGLDGDSLFFNRDLKVGGDTEAVVCLRNALDDVDGSMTADLAEIFGTAGNKALSILRKLRA